VGEGEEELRRWFPARGEADGCGAVRTPRSGRSVGRDEARARLAVAAWPRRRRGGAARA
jgi:hypothetical protein